MSFLSVGTKYLLNTSSATAKNTVISACGNFVERHSFRIVIAQSYAEIVPFYKISTQGN